MLEQFPNAVSITRSLLHGVSKKKGVLLKHRFVNLARSRLSPRLNLDTLVHYQLPFHKSCSWVFDEALQTSQK